MKNFGRIAKMTLIVLVAASAAGCCVWPVGYGRGHIQGEYSQRGYEHGGHEHGGEYPSQGYGRRGP